MQQFKFTTRLVETREDCDEACELFLGALESATLLSDASKSAERHRWFYDPAAVMTKLHDDKYALQVVDYKRRIVAAIATTRDRGVITLEGIVVEPAMQRKKIGTMLFRFFLSNWAPRMSLSVVASFRSEDEAAKAFLKSVGFGGNEDSRLLWNGLPYTTLYMLPKT